MRISQQIGWSQESKLIYQIVQQTERVNQILPGNQAGFNVPISKQIGWSNESNLYYQWLLSLSKLTSHYANCCAPTTTTSSTTTTTTTEFPVPICSQLLANDIPLGVSELYVYDLCVDYNKNVTTIDYATVPDGPYYIASNLTKFWTVEGDFDRLYEFDITFNPFSGLTDSGRFWLTPNAESMQGICAKGDSDINTLVCNLGNSLVDLDLTTTVGNPLTYTTMVPSYAGRSFVNSPIYIPSTNRVISLTLDGSTNTTYLSQFKYDGSGTLMVDINITAYVPSGELYGCSIFATTCDDVCAIYIYNHTDGKIWKVDVTTHAITDSGKTMFSPDVRTLSQLPSCTCELVPLA